MIKIMVCLFVLIDECSLFVVVLVTDVTYVVRKHYENFETIDWLKDLMRNRIRHRNIRAQRRDGWKKRLIFWFDSWSGWICVFLVGVSAGILKKINFSSFVLFCHCS